MFGNSIEGLIIKYTMGACFAGVFIIFGVKIIILLGTVAKLKLLGLLEGHELIKSLVESLLERGAVK
jgi:hypothetical protein